MGFRKTQADGGNSKTLKSYFPTLLISSPFAGKATLTEATGFVKAKSYFFETLQKTKDKLPFWGMAKNCVITLDPKVVDKASANAKKQGKSLKEVIEGSIIDMARTKEPGEWITEKALEKLGWAPSRVALWGMRSNGRLKKGKHYKKQGRFIYYNEKALKEVLAANPSNSASSPKKTSALAS